MSLSGLKGTRASWHDTANTTALFKRDVCGAIGEGIDETMQQVLAERASSRAVGGILSTVRRIVLSTAAHSP